MITIPTLQPLSPVTMQRSIRTRNPMAADVLMLYSDAVFIGQQHPSIIDTLMHQYYRRHPMIADLLPTPLHDLEQLLPIVREYVCDTIQSCGLPTHAAAVMLTRYVALLPWERIAEQCNYSERHVQRLHDSACARIDTVLMHRYRGTKKAGLISQCVRAVMGNGRDISVPSAD